METWAKLAEVCAEQLEKGRGVRVVGRLKQDRWQDQEGNPRSKVKIVAEHVEFKPVFAKKDDTSEDDTEDEAQSQAELDEAMSEEEREKVFETV